MSHQFSQFHHAVSHERHVLPDQIPDRIFDGLSIPQFWCADLMNMDKENQGTASGGRIHTTDLIRVCLRNADYQKLDETNTKFRNCDAINAQKKYLGRRMYR